MAYESSKPSPKNPAAKAGTSAKSAAKLAATTGDTKSGMPTMSGSEVTFQECDAVEEEIAELRVAYEHYFMGIDRQPPTRQYEDLKKRVMRLKGSFVRNTSAKFRVQSVHGKFATYERLWQRTMQEIENGTYKRDVMKARRRMEPKASDRPRSQSVTELPEELEEMEEMMPEPVAAPRVPSVPAMVPAVPAMAPLASTPARVPAVPSLPSIPSVAPAVKPLVPSIAPAIPSVAPAIPSVAPAIPSIAPAVPSVAPRVPSIAPAVKPLVPSIAPAVKPLVPSVAPVAARPVTPAHVPAPMAARPASASGANDLSDAKLKSVYDAYVAAKRHNKEDTSKMNYDTVAASLRKQVPELMKQHKANSVEFKVVIKDGKAVLKAVPK